MSLWIVFFANWCSKQHIFTNCCSWQISLKIWKPSFQLVVTLHFSFFSNLANCRCSQLFEDGCSRHFFPNLSIYCCGFSQIDNREKLFYYYLFQIEYFCRLFFNTNFLQFLQIVVPDQIIETSRDVIPVAYKRASKVKVGQYSV